MPTGACCGTGVLITWHCAAPCRRPRVQMCGAPALMLLPASRLAASLIQTIISRTQQVWARTNVSAGRCMCTMEGLARCQLSRWEELGTASDKPPLRPNCFGSRALCQVLLQGFPTGSAVNCAGVLGSPNQPLPATISCAHGASVQAARRPAHLACSCARSCGTTLQSGARWRVCTWFPPRRLRSSGGPGARGSSRQGLRGAAALTRVEKHMTHQ